LEMDMGFLLHNYIVVESAVLLQSRLGLGPALRFLKESESFRIHWVTAQDHRRAVHLLEKRGKRDLSFVDCFSFLVMREHKVRSFPSIRTLQKRASNSSRATRRFTLLANQSVG
jgi:predicted nucleic acid-binding protein